MADSPTPPQSMCIPEDQLPPPSSRGSCRASPTPPPPSLWLSKAQVKDPVASASRAPARLPGCPRCCPLPNSKNNLASKRLGASRAAAASSCKPGHSSAGSGPEHKRRAEAGEAGRGVGQEVGFADSAHLPGHVPGPLPSARTTTTPPPRSGGAGGDRRAAPPGRPPPPRARRPPPLPARTPLTWKPAQLPPTSLLRIANRTAGVGPPAGHSSASAALAESRGPNRSKGRAPRRGPGKVWRGAERRGARAADARLGAGRRSPLPSRARAREGGGGGGGGAEPLGTRRGRERRAARRGGLGAARGMTTPAACEPDCLRGGPPPRAKRGEGVEVDGGGGGGGPQARRSAAPPTAPEAGVSSVAAGGEDAGPPAGWRRWRAERGRARATPRPGARSGPAGPAPAPMGALRALAPPSDRPRGSSEGGRGLGGPGSGGDGQGAIPGHGRARSRHLPEQRGGRSLSAPRCRGSWGGAAAAARALDLRRVGLSPGGHHDNLGVWGNHLLESVDDVRSGDFHQVKTTHEPGRPSRPPAPRPPVPLRGEGATAEARAGSPPRSAINHLSRAGRAPPRVPCPADGKAPPRALDSKRKRHGFGARVPRSAAAKRQPSAGPAPRSGVPRATTAAGGRGSGRRRRRGAHREAGGCRLQAGDGVRGRTSSRGGERALCGGGGRCWRRPPWRSLCLVLGDMPLQPLPGPWSSGSELAAPCSLGPSPAFCKLCSVLRGSPERPSLTHRRAPATDAHADHGLGSRRGSQLCVSPSWKQGTGTRTEPTGPDGTSHPRHQAAPATQGTRHHKPMIHETKAERAPWPRTPGGAQSARSLLCSHQGQAPGADPLNHR
ncbi:collagen alpha-1(I) chain-like isoform X1 [Canis lupus familiaris]|uniref:collagen alpha-1(I) chain-like isoform X1 n=1 Tax=Canis lupus familiaris TaxID=9615 RepID=UPI0018F7DA73|nr:collagen alpha-1(I) chain-like isoform X1 [Canis lupus familiaris]